MPPYKKVKSKAQAGEMFRLVQQGKMSLQDAKGKTRGVKVSNLPKHATKKKGKR